MASDLAAARKAFAHSQERFVAGGVPGEWAAKQQKCVALKQCNSVGTVLYKRVEPFSCIDTMGYRPGL